MKKFARGRLDLHVLSRRLLPAVCDEQATHSTHSKAEKTLTDETSLDLDYMYM